MKNRLRKYIIGYEMIDVRHLSEISGAVSNDS